MSFLEKEDKSIIEYTMSYGKVNLIAFFLFIPLTIVLLGPFVLVWDFETFNTGRKVFMDYFLLILLTGVFVHEFLHGITWACYARTGVKAIKYGFEWKFITPYCHCSDPLKVKHYRRGGAMPLLILGLLPSLIAIITGSGFLLSLGLIFTWAAGGDIIALYMLRNLDKDLYVSDHPEKMGFYREL